MNKKAQYHLAVLKYLYLTQGLPVSELSRRLHKSLSFTTDILTELKDRKFVAENGYAESSGGRRPVIYSLCKNMLYIVAVAMDQFITRIVIFDEHNHPVCETEKIDLPLANNPDALSTLSFEIEKTISSAKIDTTKILGVGIAMPGLVDTVKGINYSFLPNAEKSIAAFLSQKLKLPVFIDNDSSLIALAEQRFGMMKAIDNALVVNIGWGVGLGVIVNGQLIRGNNGFAGEFSHIPLFLNGKLCSCGKTGCLETETSLPAIIEKVNAGLNEKIPSSLKGKLDASTLNWEMDIDNIIHAAQRGDSLALDVLSEAGYNIGRGLSVLIHIFNPKLIVLSGRGALAGNLWKAPIHHSMYKYTIARIAQDVEIAISELGYNAELIGAATLVTERTGKKEYEEFLKKSRVHEAAELINAVN
ncbi:MAG: ROK family protein [Chitinophagaceae bacterium]|jgi:predicted NBD/HSP70 family sugar kinase|nr:ROK family protein [Chitinophagaceae bacterium]